MNRINLQKGMTLIEILVVIAILGIISGAISAFQGDVFKNNKFANDSLTTAQDARVILRTMTKELRTASPSSNGAYAIVQAATSTVTFFSDIDADGVKEQVRYFVSSSTLKRGLIKPTGSPYTYNSGNEVITILAYNIKNSTSTPLFDYYDSTYTGTSSPLTQPVIVSNVRLVKISLMLDVDPNRSPVPITYTSQVNLRNLKDNL